MTGPFSTIIAATPKGNYKVYWMGYADDHVMDWLGCTFKHVTVAGQPHRGFKTWEEAETFELSLGNRRTPPVEVIEMPGTYIPEERIRLRPPAEVSP